MKITFASYEHTTIGFPKVILKWSVEDGKMGLAYVVIKDIISFDWTWRNQYPLPFIESECQRFDEWVRNMYSNDISVQG